MKATKGTTATTATKATMPSAKGPQRQRLHRTLYNNNNNNNNSSSTTSTCCSSNSSSSNYRHREAYPLTRAVFPCCPLHHHRRRDRTTRVAKARTDPRSLGY